MSKSIIFLIGTIATLIFSILSDYIYDWLKQRNILPDEPSVKKPWIVIGIVVTILLVTWYAMASQDSENARSKEILGGISQFSDDLERIKELLPTNVALSQCVQSTHQDGFNERFGECIESIRQNFLDARYLLRRNTARIGLLIDKDSATEICQISDRMDFLIYEMQNNQYVYERWIAEGCPKRITIVRQDEIEDAVEVLYEKYPDCLLTVETYSSFLARMKETHDLVSPLRTVTIESDRVQCLLFPGDELSIEEYFLAMNNNLYGSLLCEIDRLRTRLQLLVGKYG